MSRVFAFAAAALGAVALAASPAFAATKGRALGHAQVLEIALRVAKADGDGHPSDVRFASGPLATAVKVFDPHAHPTTRGLRALGGAKSIVDLVAMRGHFTSSGPHPHNRPAPKGIVLELIMNARSGVVFAVALAHKVPVALSRLGRVTRLR